MTATVETGSPKDTAQAALDAARATGQGYYEAGYVVGPPWWVPEPVPGTFPPEYVYVPTVTYGDGPEALTSQFLGHLWGSKAEALDEAEEWRGELLGKGYEVLPVRVLVATFGGRTYYRGSFQFGRPGARFASSDSGMDPKALLGSIGLLAGIVLVGSLVWGTVGGGGKEKG